MIFSKAIILLGVARNIEWLLFISKNEFWKSGVVKHVLINYPKHLLIMQKDNFKELILPPQC